MDYEKKYNEALYRAKSFALSKDNHIMTSVFPELKESEDEMIKQSIIADIKSKMNNCTHTLDEYYREQIAWLEKRCETFTKKDIDDAYLKGIYDTNQEFENQEEMDNNNN